MTITLAGEPESILERLIAAGRFATREQAITEALRRMWTDDEANHVLPKPFTLEEAEAVYATDPKWEKVEAALAGHCAPEA
jgi:Arc/MetJ-type ribon-helix-helix transcriptional regulator